MAPRGSPPGAYTRSQGRGEFVGRCDAILGMLLESVRAKSIQPRRHIGVGRALPHPRSWLVRDRVQHLQGRVRHERRSARHEVKEHRAQGIDVARPRVGMLAGRQALGSEIRACANFTS